MTDTSQGSYAQYTNIVTAELVGFRTHRKHEFSLYTCGGSVITILLNSPCKNMHPSNPAAATNRVFLPLILPVLSKNVDFRSFSSKPGRGGEVRVGDGDVGG